MLPSREDKRAHDEGKRDTRPATATKALLASESVMRVFHDDLGGK